MEHSDSRSWDVTSKTNSSRWYCWFFGLYPKWIWVTSTNRYRSIPGVYADGRPETWCCNHATVNIFTGQQDSYHPSYTRVKVT